MKPRARIGFAILAILLATLVALNASALCAAPVTQVTQPAHPCCPAHKPSHSDTTSQRCCLATGAPMIPAAIGAGGSGVVWTASSVAILPAIQLSTAESVDVVRPLLASPQLFLQFHQLLI